MNNSRLDPLPEEMIGNLPSIVQQELDEYEDKIRQFRQGKIGDVKMQKIRLQLGTYAQRQPGVQMQRIKIPYGALTPAKLRRLADVADKYASGFMHLTTRQDVQLYYIWLESVPNMMRELADAEITTREACGNTIRNVTATPFSGTSPDDVFDVTPYADAFTTFMLRNPICQNMGRKIKVAFESSGLRDAAGLRIHDIGFRAQIRYQKGREQRGFQVYVGGGLGSSPMLGHLYTDFLPEEELIPFSAALVRIFDRYGERKSRMKARMKFLVMKLGFEEFCRLVEEERKKLNVDESWNAYLESAHEVASPPPDPDVLPFIPAGIKEDSAYRHWMEGAVTVQNTGKHALVQLHVHNGDLSSNQARELADILEIHAVADIRITIHQNLVLRWVPLAVLPALFAALRDAGWHHGTAETLADITACPGADTCRLGITSAKGLANGLQVALKNGLGSYQEIAKDLKIKISGCPNGCAQHLTSNIGFQGAAISRDGRRVPAELVYVGGSLLGKDTRLAEPVTKIPTRNAPKVVEKLLELYIRHRNDGEHFDLVMKRLGKDRLKAELDVYTQVPSYDESPDFYKDWGHEDKSFELMTGIKGECAGATVEEKVPTFTEAEAALQQAEAHLVHKDYEVAMLESYHAIAHAAHVPLYSKLVDPFTPDQTTWQFENLFVRTGEVDAVWMNLHDRLKNYLDQKPSEEKAMELLQMAKAFYQVCRELESV